MSHAAEQDEGSVEARSQTGSPSRVALSNAYDQEQCPLFKLPGEVRNQIYRHSLTSYEDTSRLYDQNTYWSRPTSRAPQRCDTAVLRSCKRIYNEAWYIPWPFMLQTFYLTGYDRAPENRVSKDAFEQNCELVNHTLGHVEIEQVRFYAQAYVLEPGDPLSAYLDLPHFHPRCVTVAMRHTDWWNWETDERLRLDARWVNKCRLPASVQYLEMELETLERKQQQLDCIVQQMKSTWHFTRRDDVHLTARNTGVEIARWKGSSIWNNQRWVRDEVEPELLNYYVATVRWQREAEVDLDGKRISPDLRTTFKQMRLRSYNQFIKTDELEAAGVPRGTPADDALLMVQTHYQREWERARRTFH